MNDKKEKVNNFEKGTAPASVFKTALDDFSFDESINVGVYIEKKNGERVEVDEVSIETTEKLIFESVEKDIIIFERMED